ncbi:MAG: TetR/AcrR family transcriptional regulator [Ilumatobacteraceae bacterium]|nr:TetR/AcrR family transcriptional regulator [Ilumatobacteraceae bacterium]
MTEIDLPQGAGLGLPPMRPVVTRARSQRSVANDSVILDAAVAVAIDCGLEAVSLGAVAKQAGLTTGALYSRYEDNDDIQAAVFISRIADQFFEFIDLALQDFLSGNDNKTLNSLCPFGTTIPPEITLGLEALIISHRNGALGEVVSPVFDKWLTRWGLIQESSDLEIARITTALGTILGILLHRFAETESVDWELPILGLSMAVHQAQRSTTQAAKLEFIDIRATSDNEVRNALAMSAAEIIGKIGFANTTISRVARHSNLSTGTIYNTYDSKEDLLVDTLSMLLHLNRQETLEHETVGMQSTGLSEGFSAQFTAGLLPSRHKWQRFRHEAFLAARTNSRVRDVIAQVHAIEINSARETFLAGLFPPRILDGIVSGGQAVSLGYTLILYSCEQSRRGDYVGITEALSAVASSF